MATLSSRNLVMRIAAVCLAAGAAFMLLHLALLQQAAAASPAEIAAKPLSPYLLEPEIIHPVRMFANLNRQSVAYDSQGHPHVVYGKDGLYHAWYDGSQWRVETLDSNNGWEDTHATIAIQGSDIHVAYQKNARLYYTHWDGVLWQAESLETDRYGTYPSIAIESQTPYTVHIAYGSADGSSVPHQFEVRHIWLNGAGWHGEDVDTAANARDVMLKIAPTAPFTLNVAYVDEYDYNAPLLKYAWRGTQGWNVEVTGANLSSNYSEHIGFTLMPTAPFTPAIAYATGFQAYLLQRNGSTWESSSIPAMWTDPKSILGLEFEPSAPYTTHIVYTGYDLGILESIVKHYWTAGQDGQTEVVDQNYWSDGVLALGPLSPYTPTLVYLRDSKLHYSQQLTPTWWDTTVDTSGPAGVFNSLAIAPTAPFTPHVAYVFHGDLYHARRSGESWISQTIDAVGPLVSVGKYGRHVSLALAPADPFTPSVSYYDADHDRLMYAYFDGLNWLTSTVASSGWFPSLALEPIAPFTPHISYIDRGSSHLTHAWLSGSSWLTETVDDEAQAGGDSTALAIAISAPYTQSIAYYDRNQATVNYAQHTTGGWMRQTVDHAPYTDQYAKVALAFDPIAPYTPHLGYVWAHHGNMWTRMTVLHAQLINTGWQTETVEKSTDVTSARDLSLAIEPLAPYRLYMEFISANDQFLAYRENGRWQTQQWSNVTSDREQYSSLALAPMSPTVPFVTYASPIAGDLIIWSGTEPSHFAYLPLIFRGNP